MLNPEENVEETEALLKTLDIDEAKVMIGELIKHWRAENEAGATLAGYYVDAYQTVYLNIFGELFPC